MTSSSQPWTTVPLVALDLEGSGAQDYDDEAILEVAIVPIIAGHPDAAAAYARLINPGRAIPRRRWISPGLTTEILAAPWRVQPSTNTAAAIVGQERGW